MASQSDRPPSGSLAAYNAYQQAKSYASSEAGAHKRIEALNRAIQLDPQYAQAYAGLAFAWADLSGRYLGGAQAQQAYANARVASATALALNPNLAVAHFARGFLLEIADFNWTGAEAEYRRALQLAPNNGPTKLLLGNLLATLGHPAQALSLTRQTIAIDPRNAGAYFALGRYLASSGHFDDAVQAIRKVLELIPGDPGGYRLLAEVETQRGDAKAALRAAHQVQGHGRNSALALAQQISGDPAAADAALKTLIDKDAGTSAYQIAQTYALRKQPDQMFKWLDRAWTIRDGGIIELLDDPFILRYKGDPRFAAFCRKVGLPVPGSAPAPAPAPAATPATTQTP